MSDYYCLVTAVGRSKLAASTKGSPLQLATMAIGDANGTTYDPDDTATALVHEVTRVDLSSVTQDVDNPNWVLCEAHLPPTVGGWWIREAGLYDSDGDLIAIAKYPPTYKPILNDGTSIELALRIVIEIVNADVVQLVVDPNVLMASQTYVTNQLSSLSTTLSVAEQIPGGKTDQVLAKQTDEDGVFKWVNEMNPRVYFRGQF